MRKGPNLKCICDSSDICPHNMCYLSSLVHYHPKGSCHLLKAGFELEPDLIPVSFVVSRSISVVIFNAPLLTEFCICIFGQTNGGLNKAFPW